MTTEPTPTVRELSVDECWQRLTEHPSRVGRIGLGGPSPDIFPVNYTLDGRSVVVRTAEGKKLAAVGRDERIVFEVDDIEAGWRRAWSVVLRGFAEHITDAAEVTRLEELPLVPWDPGPKSEFLRIATHVISGRAIS